MIDTEGFDAGRKALKVRLAKNAKEVLVIIAVAYLLVIILTTADHVIKNHNYSILKDSSNYWQCLVIALLIAALYYFRSPYWHRFRQTLNKLKQSSDHYHEINSILTQRKPFVLYLNNFSSDVKSEYHTAPFDDAVAGHSTYGNEKARKIINAIDRFLPVIYLSNINDLTTEKKGLCLLCTNENWYRYFELLASHAKFIVLDYSEEFAATKNIRMELEVLKTTGQKLLLFTAGTSLEKIRKEYPEILSRAIHTNLNVSIDDSLIELLYQIKTSQP